jgi:hypothetical protein
VSKVSPTGDAPPSLLPKRIRWQVGISAVLILAGAVGIQLFSPATSFLHQAAPLAFGASGALAGAIAIESLVNKFSPLPDLRATQEEVRNLIKAIEQSGLAKLVQDIDEKKRSFLNIPAIALHYADKEQIKDIYADYFREPTVERIESDVSRELGGDVSAEVLGTLGARGGRKDAVRLRSEMRPADISVSEMFRRYQAATIRNGQVNLGLELVNLDLSELKSFDDLTSQLRSKFDMRLNQGNVDERRRHLKEKGAARTVQRLSNATGWVLVEGGFTIRELDEASYQLSYDHPVNEYLANPVQRISIMTILSKELLEPHVAANYRESVGRPIPLKVYGRMWEPVHIEAGVTALRILPLAVY